MNETQIRGMREMHEETNRVCKRTMTAREMALAAHSLSRDGNTATMDDGSRFIWDARFSRWAMWSR